tara:strand:- start:829 stop:1077 length:249 start_codon:yes stop_codon:yes gene_type:complete
MTATVIKAVQNNASSTLPRSFNITGANSTAAAAGVFDFFPDDAYRCPRTEKIAAAAANVQSPPPANPDPMMAMQMPSAFSTA